MNEKELYLKKLRARLDQWQAEIDKLKARAAEAEADARIKMNKHIAPLQEKIDEARAKMKDLSKAGEEAWGDLKAGADLAWDSLKMAFDDAAKRFKHK